MIDINFKLSKDDLTAILREYYANRGIAVEGVTFVIVPADRSTDLPYGYLDVDAKLRPTR